MSSPPSDTSPPSAPLPPSGSIGIIVNIGIVVTGVLFTAMSIIALFGFYSFQEVLHEFSEKTFPITMQEAQLSILMGQLAQQTNLLQSADSQQERHAAFNNISSQFNRIISFSSSGTSSLQINQQGKLECIKQSVTTLNNLISKRITAKQDLHAANTILLVHITWIHKKLEALLATQPPPKTRETIKVFEELAFDLLIRNLRTRSPANLLRLKKESLVIADLIEQMQEATMILPSGMQILPQSLVRELNQLVFGEKGTLFVEKKSIVITNNCTQQTVLIHSLLQNKGNSSVSYFFDLTTSVANDSMLLSERVYRQIRILSVLFILSLFLAIGSFFYFQRFLIKRLTHLNTTVLAMVAGENLQIEETGNDEITAIANSINYFSAELHKAKSIAEKSAEQKADFLAHMSHEIRTPLNAILGFSDLALKTNSPTEHLDFLNKINRASHLLLGIINSILDISKIEAGKFTFDNVEFDLRNLLEDLSSIISLKCEESGLHFYYNIEPGTPYKLMGDPLRLTQILTNLVTNAFKFTEEGNIIVHISAPKKESNWNNKTSLLFSVQDTGEGIPPEQAQHLFQPFTQADNSITRKYGGTGLGLAICKNLVEMMGGDIWLKNNELKGSTFSFTSPFELPAPSSFYVAPEELQGLSAVVMSRSPQSATELSIQLDHFGFTIFQTLSIDEILARIQQNNDKLEPTDKEIFFIDCEDLSFQWQEAIKSIKSTMTAGNISPLILTGPQRLSTHFHAQHRQVSDYFLITPITPARLLDAVTSVLNIDNPHCLQNQSVRPMRKEIFSKTYANATILLVEDNDINSQIASAYLKSRNLAVVTAHNGAEALEILLGTNGPLINAILMDIQMPVMDGYTATKAIRAFSSPLANIPIVALTAHAMPEEREKCLSAGMNAYITKPINADDLFQTLEELINDHIGKQQNQTITSANLLANLPVKNSSLNMKTGLAQVMSDPALYMDLLKSFVKKYKSWPENILIALKNNELKECRHLVHSLKGVSGNLGMEKLFSISTRLEIHIRNNEIEATRQLLAELQIETKVVCDFLKDWLDENKDNQWQSQESTNKLSSYSCNIEDLTKSLTLSLKNNSSKALKQIQLLRSQLGEEESSLLNKVEEHAKNLDFSKAQTLLTQWKNQ